MNLSGAFLIAIHISLLFLSIFFGYREEESVSLCFVVFLLVGLLGYGIGTGVKTLVGLFNF